MKLEKLICQCCFFSLFLRLPFFFWAIVMVPGFVETAATAGNVHVVFEHVKPQSGAESILPLFIR